MQKCQKFYEIIEFSFKSCSEKINQIQLNLLKNMEKKDPLTFYSIFICNSCHLACVGTPSSWIIAFRLSSDNEQTVVPKLSENEQQTVVTKTSIENKTFVLNFKEEWTFKKQYDEIAKSLKKNFIDLPLCSCCLKRILAIGYTQFSLIQSLEMYISKINDPKIVEQFADDILYKIKKGHTDNRDFRNAIKTVGYQKGAPYQPEKPTFISRNDKNDTINNTFKLKSSNLKQDSSFKSCTMHSVFYISFIRHYATINGYRLGSLTPDFVTRKEVDTGLFFLAQLVIFIGNIIGVNMNDIQAKNCMEIRTENGDFSEVHFPKPKSKQKRYDTFNNCMDKFFQICYNIFSKKCINESHRRPPFHIDISIKRIGDLPYKFSKKDPSRWTHVMRLLAVNLKTIQFLALENFIDSIE